MFNVRPSNMDSQKPQIALPVDQVLWRQVERAFTMKEDDMSNQQAREFVENWARDELENRGEGKELEILQFFEQKDRRNQTVT